MHSSSQQRPQLPLPPPPATTVVYVHHGGPPAPHPAHYHHHHHHAYAPWGAPVGGSAAPHSYHYHHQHQYSAPYGDPARANHAAPPLHHPQHHYPLHAHHSLPFAPAGYPVGGYGPAPGTAPASYPATPWYGPPPAVAVRVHQRPEGTPNDTSAATTGDYERCPAGSATATTTTTQEVQRYQQQPSQHHQQEQPFSSTTMTRTVHDSETVWARPPSAQARARSAASDTPRLPRREPKKLKQPPPGRSATQLIVNYLDNAADDVELRRIFSGAGAVESARVMYDAHTNEPLGYGFVYMQTAEDASRAVTLLNRYPLRKKRLKVSFANPKRDNAPPPTAKLQMPAVNTADVTSASASAEQSGALPTTSASNSGTAAVSGPSGSSSGPASGGPSGSSGGDGSGNGSGGSDTSSSRRQDR